MYKVNAMTLKDVMTSMLCPSSALHPALQKLACPFQH